MGNAVENEAENFVGNSVGNTVRQGAGENLFNKAVIGGNLTFGMR